MYCMCSTCADDLIATGGHFDSFNCGERRRRRRAEEIVRHIQYYEREELYYYPLHNYNSSTTIVLVTLQGTWTGRLKRDEN